MKDRKGILLTGLLIFCSFVIAALISIQDLHSVLEKNHKVTTEALASKIYNEIGMELRDAIQSSLTMSSDYFLKRMLASADFPGNDQTARDIVSYLDSYRTGLRYNTVFVVSSLNHKYYTFKGYNKTVDPENDSHDIWYAEFVGSKKQLGFDVDTDQINNNILTVFVNSRVEDEKGDLLGVCGVGINMGNLQDTLLRYEKAYHVKVNLADSQGLVMVDTDDDNIESAVLRDAVANFEYGSEFSYRRSETGGFIVSKFISEIGWYLVVASESDDDSVYLNMLVRQAIGFLAVMIVLSIAMYLLVRHDRNQLVRVATTDGMTGLHNKNSFLEKAEKLNSTASSFPAAFIFLDLDNFKKANDTLGHATGDQIIRDAAAVLKNAFRSDDLIGRFGGDEYVIMLANLPEHGLQAKLEGLNEKMRFVHGNGEAIVRVTASIGVAYCKKPAGSLAEMMAVADEELYKAKQAGRDRFSLRCLA